MLSLRSEVDAAVWERSHVRQLYRNPLTTDFPQAFQNDHNNIDAVNKIGPLLVKLSRLFRAGRYLFSNGAAFNTRSCRSLTSDAISLSLSQMNRLRYERDIASLVRDLWLRVLNAAPFENSWWRLTANQGTGFTDEMRMHIAWDISPSPKETG